MNPLGLPLGLGAAAALLAALAFRPGLPAVLGGKLLAGRVVRRPPPD